MLLFILKLLMILTSGHHHPGYTNFEPSRKRKVLFDAQKETQKQFDHLLTMSRKSISEDNLSRLQIMRKDREDKAYAKLDESASDYLLILLKQRNEKIDKDANSVQEILQKRQKDVIKDLKMKKLSIQRNQKSIKMIKEELDQNLEVMRMKNPEKHIPPEYYEEIKRIQEAKYENHFEFRRRSYWKVPNQRHQSALQLISSLQKQQKRQRQRYERSIQMSQKKKISQQQHEKEKIQQKIKRQKAEQHQRYKQQRQNKFRQMQQLQKKQQQTQQFLSKFNNRAPAHIVLQQNYKKIKAQEEQRIKNALSELKQKKKQNSFSLSQINQRIRQYEEDKQKHAEQLQQRRLLQLQSEQQIKSRLGQLYKSKIRSSTAAEQIKAPDQKQQRHQKVMKMQMYSQIIKEKHLPKVDPQKRDQLLQSINDSIKRQHKIQKKTNGEVILLNKDDLDPRQIGLRYLSQLKQMTSLIERKPPNLPPVKQFKLVDRSLLKKSPKRKDITISNWKEIIDDSRLSQAQKQQKLQDYFKLIQQSQMKSSHDQKNASLAKSLQLQKRKDHYELQKAAAKLAFLKSFM